MRTASLRLPLRIEDEVGKLANNIAENWLIGIRETNPAILDMFHERDRKPYRELLPWSGEFAGKYITGAYYIYRLTHHETLYCYILKFLEELLTCIDEDGYAGCFQKKCRLTGAYSQMPENTGATWDAWAHYHIMLGLYLWHQETKDERLFAALKKIADFFIRSFYGGEKRLADIGSVEMNLSPYRVFALLYRETGDKRYLAFAKEIERDFTTPPAAGNYLNLALAGVEFYKMPKSRWESLHIVLGIAAMYRATGEARYKQAVEWIFYSILKTDVHNTGGFSTGERAIGTPFVNGVIDLCSVITYHALACDVLKMTGDIRIADFLEMSLFNAILGSFSPSGRWSTYNTPMEGIKEANYQSIGFQSRPGSPDLNSCSAIAAQGVGMLSEWAILQDNRAVYLNYFGKLSCETADGLQIRIDGDYPVENKIDIFLRSRAAKRVAIRIPAWSKHTTILYKDSKERPAAGSYWSSEQIWDGAPLRIEFDFTPRQQEGSGDYYGKSSVYLGPVLYGYDLSLGGRPDAEGSPPVISRSCLKSASPERRSDGRILLRLSDGVTLCGFSRLGITGSVYFTWFAGKK